MKKFYKKFISRKELIEALTNVGKDHLDVEATIKKNAKLSRHSYILVDKEGTVRVSDNFKKFMFMFTHVTGLKTFHKLCFGNTHIFHVFTEEDIFGTEREGGTFSGLSDKKVVTPVTEPDGAEDKNVSEDKVSLDKYVAISDGKIGKREAKNLLEKAVKEDFDIDLNKGKTFEDMIEELRTLLVEKGVEL